ncbi:MAG: D-glycero-beta-D-manno-heptose 1-phosphate adenylyltransferase [Bacteroidia bacterium]
MAIPIPTHLDIVQSKIFTRETLTPRLLFWRFHSKKIVFTNGCFDILHRGHIDYLSKAADCGQILIIGLNSDASVKKLNKGKSRPLQDETSRALILASLHFVSAVILFDEDTPYELIKLIQPDVLVKGADYKVEQIAGHDIVLSRGGEVKLIPFLEGFSTSGIEQKIKNS